MENSEIEAPETIESKSGRSKVLIETSIELQADIREVGILFYKLNNLFYLRRFIFRAFFPRLSNLADNINAIKFH
jgi:hypothetical protein